MGSESRGFASMTKDRVRALAHHGGTIAHLKGHAHEWTVEEARAAGKKGAAVNRQRAIDHRTRAEIPGA